MSSDFHLVIDVRQLLRRLINPDLGLVLVMPYVLGIDRWVWVDLVLSDRTCFINNIQGGEGAAYRRRMLPSLRNWTAFRITSRTVSNISSSIPDQLSYGKEGNDVPLAPSEHGHIKTSIKVKEQNATSSKSRTFNIVIGYFCSSALYQFYKDPLAYFTISHPSS